MLLPLNPRKRVLDQDPSTVATIEPSFPPSPIKRHKSAYNGPELPRAVDGECARLITNDPSHGKRALIIQLDQEFRIGRSVANDYQVLHRSVSNFHCRLYSLVSDTGEVLICLEDISLNGTLHNDRKLSKSTVVLCEGDRIEIGSQVFRFFQTIIDSSGFTSSRSASTAALELYHSLSIFQRVGDYTVLPCTLGSGAFATVVLAFNLKTLKQVACKKMTKKVVGEKNLGSVRREVEMLKKAHHPNINKIVDVEISDGIVHIFLELVSGGDLFSYLVKKGRLDAPEAKWIMYQVFQSLVYLHEDLNVAHRDIKLENVILCNSGPFPKVQLADFGQASIANRDFQSLKGTLSYMAPEILKGWSRREGYSGKVSDIWSTGVLLSFLLIGGHPFEPIPESDSQASSSYPFIGNTIFGPTASGEFQQNSVEQRLCINVVNGKVGLPRIKFGSHDQDARNLLSSLMNPDATNRISAKQALRSKWFRVSETELKELYKKLVGAVPVA
ncbi:FHA domain-containing serine/threonine-protein kinase [Sporobolomyces salmoneus]|uniref:FHA domain-containing serine/threonine-protein kinase n=1 Tax=Sporobolomyces salmoneus TaxID=183962 RepID=UPI00316D1929